MTDLPPGWEWADVGQIAETTLGKMLDRGKIRGYESVPYLRNINVQWGRIDLDDVLTMEMDPAEQSYFRLQPGDLLMCEGGEIGRCAIWPAGRGYMAFQKALHRIRPFGGIDPLFLRYLFEHLSERGRLAAFATGSTIKHLPQQQLRRIPIPLPPQAEQQRIVACLDECLARIERGVLELHELLTRVKSFRKAVLTAACTGRLGPSTPDPLNSTLPDAGTNDGLIPAIPRTWRWTRLGQIADVVGGVTKDAKKQSDPALPAVPYLRVANVQRGRLDLTHVASIRVPPGKALALALQPGDILLNEGGDRDKLGRGWIWEGQLDGCIHQNHVFRARICNDELHPKLLAWHANEFGQAWCERNGKQSVNLASISLSKIRMLPVPVPPAEEQDPLVAAVEEYLTVIDDGERLVRDGLAKSDSLRRSLLADAFAGRLVPQDPADEPASVLLERIRAERAAAGSVPRNRRSRSPRTSAPSVQDRSLDVVGDEVGHQNDDNKDVLL